MPRKKGSVNYKNDLLIDIVGKFLPNGEYGWQTVALAYQEMSKEDMVAGGSLTAGEEGGGDDELINESFESARETDDDDNRMISVPGENTAVPVVPPRIPQPTPQQENAPAYEDMTPCVGLRRAESTMKAQKTKNSSNKIKERTSIAGAIVKLIEKQDSGEAGLAANVSMMMLRQLEAMNKSMDKRDERERRRERKERKRRKKRRAKKKAKKRAKYAVQLDHGGKAGPGGSSSSSDTTDYGDSSDDSSSDSSDKSSNYGRGPWRGKGIVTVDE